jgi:hypothetical protein
MKRQSIGPEVLHDFLLIQDGTIRPHEHVIVRVQFFKRSVVLAMVPEFSFPTVTYGITRLLSLRTASLPFV